MCTEFARGFFNEKDKAPFPECQTRNGWKANFQGWQKVSPYRPVTTKICTTRYLELRIRRLLPDQR